MEEKISIKLADPEIYSDNEKEELIHWNAKYAEVRKALRKAEEIWEKSQKTLDKALTENLRE
jgi:ATP-binding cassette subfamily F protein 3